MRKVEARMKTDDCRQCAEFVKNKVKSTEVPFDEDIKFKANVVKGRDYYFVPVSFNVPTNDNLAVFRENVLDDIVEEAEDRYHMDLSIGERRVTGLRGYRDYGVYCAATDYSIYSSEEV